LSASILAASLAPHPGGLLYEGLPYISFLIFIAATAVLSVLALARIFEEETEEN
jgi:hypothetical protein